MMEQYGAFGGLYTFNYVEFGNFEKRSKLRYENDYKAIANRYDVNNHFGVLCKQKSYKAKQLIIYVSKLKKFK